MIDFQELKGSEGNSSVLMDAYGHRIYFTLSDAKVPGYIEIRKSGWMGFTYECFIDNQKVKEATEGVAHCQEMVFKVLPYLLYCPHSVRRMSLSYSMMR